MLLYKLDVDATIFDSLQTNVYISLKEKCTSV